MSSDLEKSFISTCGRSGSFAEKYNVTYDEAWDLILGKRNSTEEETTDAPFGAEAPFSAEGVTHVQTATKANVTDAEADTEQSGKDMWVEWNSPLDDDEYINDDEEGSEVTYK